ncbi:MAG: ribosomal subunit interface protein [Parcubacteria group bacterium LiPW_39]|nr:MAG: ribosomal subunit interface protein [Parcubacteria group bacterium LiPW_39]
MRLIIKSKDLKIPEAAKDYLQKKLETLKKFFKNFNPELIKVEVELGRTTRRHKEGDIFRAEVNLSINGRLFRAESERSDLYAAIDEVRDDLEREIKSFKTKKETIFIRGARSITKKFRLSPLARFKK